ncbi:TonB-dependent receptor domain-containing protein [Teredinibacter haidensis]|uniref:TonB-dependent receptor domain-containing protein n=1 Tax=Teredinibacter haidensis TaxID=2731755 RepID=UPI0009491B29|nr:TonB-dependent receptor [Teredinibacter haidensis]
MKTKYFKGRVALAAFPLSILSVAISAVVHAQDQTEAPVPPAHTAHQLEETIVLGRLKSAANDVIVERMEQSVAVDIITSDMIGRVADSTVAEALRRLPGVTTVDDKYVYVRGLGERYLSTTLNGAVVPSPDLTRNVIPLDIFPTSIVENLSVQKVASADMPAAFGSGHVDIRTTGIPDGFVFTLELSTGSNSESDGDFLTYAGGDDDSLGEDDGTRELSAALRSGLAQYRGNFDPSNIQSLSSGELSLDDAEAINRSLASELYRDVSVKKDSGEPDVGIDLNIGNVWAFDNGIELGFLAGGSYGSKWRNETIYERSFSDPEELRGFIERSTFSVDITGNLSLGMVLNSENRIDATNLFIRNTDDQVQYDNFHNANDQYSSGNGRRYTEYEFEQREAVINQIHGQHELGYETLEVLDLSVLNFLEGLSLDWYYSDSEATTDIPSSLRVISFTETDPNNGGAVLESRVGSQDRSSAQYRFSDLNDYLESSGWEMKFPIETGDFRIELIGGSESWKKTRYFEQLRFNLGATAQDSEVFIGPLGELYSDANVVNPDYGFEISVQDASSSYLAANKVNAAYSKLDITWNDAWRFAGGIRWEDYQQVNLGWNPNEFDASPISGLSQAFDSLAGWVEGDPNPVAEFFDEATYVESDYFGSAAFTFMAQNFWAEDFQLRLSYAETTVRPDLRDIANSSFLDPITDVSVNGNPNVRPSMLDNLDLRAEWYFSSGDNLTVSLFYKDITDPIELFESAATDENVAAEVLNGESAEVSGLEFEYYFLLSHITDVLSPFFTQGNVTLLEHELIVGDEADSPTNDVRGLQGASDYSANFLIGFDADDGMHSATLAYNVFGERLFFAGRNGSPDTFEQPFNSLNFTYSFYPTDYFTLKFEAENLLDESLVIQRTFTETDGSERGVDVIETKPGLGLSLKAKLKF